ncbi:Nucleotidyltransferase [Lentzea xinjiangensis]|uniref:Nucleotidyltransferase n=1 Tax=Lentzea xinjiangensis TaxID=402600 RepID=A0A1H9DX73_9PSEU|nr:hypothetical protein [Lentzea xinjiangensis]SEQ18110.1 Nucleotidyltransferase [Lentzea xinjiangensis]
MIPQEYVKARAVLLDALDGLGPHRDALVLVGAQAVYLHAGDADFVTAPTTTDADLALVPGLLADEPSIFDAMHAAGFAPGRQPGSWTGPGDITVDLMAPEALCGRGGRRSAHLQPPHDAKATARRTPGLEPAVVDNEVRRIGALDPRDARTFEIRVAGPAALVVSKVVKIAERREQPHRLKPKDGLDVLRLLRAIDMTPLASSLVHIAADGLAGPVVADAVVALRELAAGPEDLLPRLAADAEAGFSDPDEIKMSVVVLVADLLQEFDDLRSK